MQHIEVQSTRIAYTESGKGEQVFVCLHDAWDCAETFAPLMKWADFGRWVAFDLPGFGESSLPSSASYGVATTARLLSEALERLGLFRVVLVGHGFGALVASWIASHDPERVVGLCLLNATFAVPSLSWGLRLSRRVPFRWLSRYALGERALRWRLRAQMTNPPKPERAQSLAKQLEAHRQERLSFLQTFHPEECTALLSRLPLLSMPVLCIQGTPTTTPWKEFLPNATQENVSGCAQYPHEEQPEQVAALLQSWHTINFVTNS